MTNKLTKPQAALYERVKAERGLLRRELSAAENRMAHKLADMKLIALDGTISSRGPYNQAAQNDQVWVLYEDMHPDQKPAPSPNCRCDGSGVLMDKIGDGGRPGRCPCRDTPSPQPNLDGEAANKAEAILRVVRKLVAAENAHAEKPHGSHQRVDLDFLLMELVGFTPADIDQALRIVRRRRSPSPQPRVSALEGNGHE